MAKPQDLGSTTPAYQHPHGLLDHPLQPAVALVLLVLLIALPWAAELLNADFYTSVASRMLILALAATSLNFILGFGSMISFGHAAFVGVGAYTVGILMADGVVSGWIAWPAAIVVAGLFAFVIGLISLRTRGVYFIMITLAFAQMLFYLMVSLQQYGGEDGLPLASRSHLGLGLDLSNDMQFYYVVLAICAVLFVAFVRLLNSRFGHVLQAIRENETRMMAMGFRTYRYKLLAFTLAGAAAGLAGALLANQSSFVSPALLYWTESGVLLVMVILGGVGHIYGGFGGAVAYLLIEEISSGRTMYWHFWLGAILLVVVLLAPNGLLSLARRKAAR